MAGRRNRLKFHHDVAWIMMAFFVVSIAVLTVLGSWLRDPGSNRRFLEEENGDNDDFSSYSCGELLDLYPNKGEAQCRFARTCNQGEGLFMARIFCSSWKYTVWCGILAPFFLVWMFLLFLMLGSTAEDFFSPSLEMFSFKLKLPPRFAGVTLLALGNGAADVSSTVSAITSDPKNGYLLSLGALTGSAMFIGAVVAGAVIIVAKGVPCRGALVRDVTALGITALVVMTHVLQGSIGPGTVSLFCSLYLLFVAIVLVADVYHRAVVLPRLQQADEANEVARQLRAEQHANEAIGDALDDFAENNNTNNNNNNNNSGVFGTVMTALSNYDNNPEQSGDGWGVESSDLLQSEQPVVLHGANGILNREGDDTEAATNNTPYTVLEDGANNRRNVWHEGTQEIKHDLHRAWLEIFEEEDENGAKIMLWSRAFMVFEYPFVVLRKLTVPIPCEGYYNRGIVAVSVALSPIWLGYYFSLHDINIWWRNGVPWVLILFGVALVIAGAVLRYAPSGDGVMPLTFATPIALYGFLIAATWIDFVSDHLVALLALIGIVCRIPGSIMGLTILAWGNSMGDLSADITMARKGLANMAMTACFAGPVFNILVGLGLGFSSLSVQTDQPVIAVTANVAIITGFVFILINTTAVVIMGTWVYGGRIPKSYGYMALGLYTVYVITSVLLQFSRS